MKHWTDLLAPLFFYLIALWFFRFGQGRDIMGNPRPGVTDTWRNTTGRTIRRVVILFAAAYTALLFLNLRSA
ncbi:hypothetical protein LJY25_04470 [Hymenobacter sp. BT175]|uniref:hypothetical protein n=1 Tax=Hymenobacter translucens TaxID=2886507 RepID=UPI001D0E6A3D|nr:hypothetical protein [Hymenobacter translucens]MCC2545689.1 hypothetical protein [Hymenobacter translucens]